MDWQEAQEEIKRILADALYRIEWHYGANRAPFIFPPAFKETEGKEGRFRCIVTEEDSPGYRFEITASTPEGLLVQVRCEIYNRYLSFLEDTDNTLM